MSLNEYFKPIKNGELMTYIYGASTLLLWVVYGFQLKYFFSHLKQTKWYKHSNLIILSIIIIYCIPFYLAFKSFYGVFFANKPILGGGTPEEMAEIVYPKKAPNAISKFPHKKEKKRFTIAATPPGFGFCMDSKVKEEDKKLGVLAYWDYACTGSNTKFMERMGRDLLNRFYYINYAIFLVVILVYNTVTRINILKSPFMIFNISFSLLLGTIGCLLPIFQTWVEYGNVRNLILTSMWMNILTMNVFSFIFIGLTILLGIV